MVGALDGGQRGVDRRAERNVPVLVGRTNLDHRYVARHGAAAVELLRLAEEDGDVVGVAALGDLTHVGADEERIELEDARELGIGVGRRTLGVEMVDVDVLQLTGLAARAHGVDKALRSRSHGTQMDVVARFDHFDRLFGGDEMDGVLHAFMRVG